MLARTLTVAAVIAVGLPSGAAAQWRVSTAGGAPMAEAIGSRGLGVGVFCSSNSRQSVTVILPGEPLEAGRVQARWSDGTTDEYRFRVDGNGHLIGSALSTDFQRMIDKLRRLNSVTLRVTRSNGQGFEDTVGLSGSSRAIGQITCGGPRESRRVDRSASVCDQVRVVGESSQDADRARRFCRSSVVLPNTVTGIEAYETLLWVHVTEPFAREMLADTLTAESLVRTWMSAWKSLSGSAAVTVYIMWRNIEVAQGDVALFGGDRVRFRGR
ncbi:MAG: hypothetical protein OXG35_07200 [Acidobacteria bacterium]|nr:hypothetical protein [Acidobacteriota bacterium]